MTKILDIQQSIAAANGNASLAKELFTMLLNDLDARLRQIKTSFDANDMYELAEHIHKLYGATAYCIIPKLRNSVETLDQALREKDYSQVSKLVETVTDEIQQLLKDGPAYIKKDWLNL